MNTVKKQSMSGFSQFEITSDLLRNLNKFNLTPVAKLVLLELTTHMNIEKNNTVVFPSIEFIAKVLGVGLTATKTAVKDLIKEGLIIKSKRSKIKGNYNKYLLTSKVRNLTSEPSENEFIKKPESELFMITNKNRIDKEQTKKNVVVLNDVPDIIKSNTNIKDKCAYWASLSNEVKKDYLIKDKNIKKFKKQKKQEHKELIESYNFKGDEPTQAFKDLKNILHKI